MPSPTFLLMQSYEGDAAPIVHADFYRIEKPGELDRTRLGRGGRGALTLVEWPERGGELSDRRPARHRLRPRSRAGDGAGATRTATVSGYGALRAPARQIQGPFRSPRADELARS